MKHSIAMKSALSAAVLGFLALGLASTPAFAAAATTPLNVSVTVAVNCTISSTSLTFPTYTGLAEVNSTATLTLTCTGSTPYNVGLGSGTATGATTSARKMQNGAASLNYSLTSVSSTGPNWGDTIGTDTITGTGNGTGQTLTVYGTLPASQVVTNGTYTDTVTATITY